jgi:hypothetical protein
LVPKKLYVNPIGISAHPASSNGQNAQLVVGTEAVPPVANVVAPDGAAIEIVVDEAVNPELAKFEANSAVFPAQTAVGVEVGVNATASITPTV